MPGNEKILLIDGNNLSIQAMYASPALYDRVGNPTGCLMTSIRMICKIAEQIRPFRTIMLWDGGHSKFRKSIYPEYKAKAPLDEDDPKFQFIEEWKKQVVFLKEYLPFLGIGQIFIPGCEADDLIYRVYRILASENFHSVIASSDADFNQLISLRCSIYNLKSEKVISDWEEFKSLHGIHPAAWAELRAITGDSSDNIEGIRGIGPKKASEILNRFNGLEGFELLAKRDPNFYHNFPKKHFHAFYENYNTVLRNLKLMDLSSLPEEEIPQQELEALLLEALNLEPQKDIFWKKCQSHQLSTLLEENAMWNFVLSEG